MALANYATTKNLYQIIGGVASFLMVGRDTLTASFETGGAAGEAEQTLVDVCNRVHEQLVADNIALNQANENLTLSPGTLEYAIPATLFRSDILWIKYQNTDGIFQDFPINYISPKDFRMQWGVVQNADQAYSMFPAYYTLDEDQQMIKFTGFTQGGTYVVAFREAPVEWTVEDLTDDESENYASIPNTFIDVLELLIAVELGERMDRPDLVMRFNAKLHNPLSNSQYGRMRQMQDALGVVGAAGELGYKTHGTPVSNNLPLRFGGAGSGYSGSGYGNY